MKNIDVTDYEDIAQFFQTVINDESVTNIQCSSEQSFNNHISNAIQTKYVEGKVQVRSDGSILNDMTRSKLKKLNYLVSKLHPGEVLVSNVSEYRKVLKSIEHLNKYIANGE